MVTYQECDLKLNKISPKNDNHYDPSYTDDHKEHSALSCLYHVII